MRQGGEAELNHRGTEVTEAGRYLSLRVLCVSVVKLLFLPV